MENQTIIEALLLGLLEGLTEFIPVSSTGHILLAGHFLGFESTGKAFEVLIQLGAILAILSVYAARFWDFMKRRDRLHVISEVVIGILATLIWMGGCAVEFVSAIVRRRRPNLFVPPQLPDDPFETPKLICIMLILGGIVLLWIDRLDLRPKYHEVREFPLSLYLKIGLFQCLAMIPGTSRSGATIVGGLLMGADKRAAAEFSFFLAMPTMLGAFTLDLCKNWNALSASDLNIIVAGFLSAFVAAVIVVRSLLGYVSRHGYRLFGWWRLVVGTVGLAALYIVG